ncbi:MAG TPA: threonine/serine dehydratase [Bacillales bacterium]|nr:threonine/serine dehydratase [Bacillales bacterium]
MIGLRDIKEAGKSVAGEVHETPLLQSRTLSEMADNEVYLKAEHLQKTGSFKIRGAANKLKSLAGTTKHVVAASSGNHGQAVAYMAARLGMKATIFVPDDAARCKVDAIKSYGAAVLEGGPTSKTRLAKARVFSKEKDAVFIPPYDDPFIMAGQGTVGLEILRALPEVDVIYVPIGGGGLISGISTAIKETNPEVRVIGVEPEGANDAFQSLAAGKIVSIDHPETAADGLRALQPGEMTYPVIRNYVDEIVLVSETEIKQAFTFMLERMKQLVEPSGAVAIAAVMANKACVSGKKAAAVVSGGNVALERIPALIHTEAISNA